jgi:hypothetical protein
MTRSTLQTRSIVTATFGILATLGIGSFASADPLPGETLKFYQSPLNGGPPGVYPVQAVPQAVDQPAPFLGQDIESTATTTDPNDPQTYTGKMAADDFLDTNPNPIAHVTFWGSYLEGTDPGTAGTGVQKFRITLYQDIPAVGTPGTTNYIPSQPGTPIVSQTVNLVNGPLASSSATFTATPVAANGPGALPGGESGLYEYNAELNWDPNSTTPNPKTFPDADVNNTSVADPIEWISIVALVPPISPTNDTPSLDWGWHDRDYGISDPLAAPGFDTQLNPTPPPIDWHGGDDAVYGGFSFTSGSGGLPSSGPYNPLNYSTEYDGTNTSMDMAFALYTVPTVPEPASLGLLAMAIPALLVRRRRHCA